MAEQDGRLVDRFDDRGHVPELTSSSYVAASPLSPRPRRSIAYTVKRSSKAGRTGSHLV